MAKSLAELKAAYATPANTTNSVGNGQYPFWNMKVGESCTVRFLTDANEDNPLGFLKEKLMHNLEINGEKKVVPCLKMYGENCPVCKTSSDFYKAEGDDSPNGKKYWRKKQHLAQALILKDPLPADKDTGETHVGKVRTLTLGFQIYNVIMQAFKDDELEESPDSITGGYDFVIKKSQQGKYDSYGIGTKFTKQRPLSPEEIEIAEESTQDLDNFLPKNPGVEKVQAMLDAALTGSNYAESSTSAGNDDEDTPTPSRAKPVAVKAAAKPVVEDDEDDVLPPSTKVAAKPAAAKPMPKVEEPADDSDTDVDDMLQTIRARRAKVGA